MAAKATGSDDECALIRGWHFISQRLCAALLGQDHRPAPAKCRGPQTLAKGELSTQVDLTRSPIVPNDLRLRGPSGAKDEFLLANDTPGNSCGNWRSKYLRHQSSPHKAGSNLLRPDCRHPNRYPLSYSARRDASTPFVGLQTGGNAQCGRSPVLGERCPEALDLSRMQKFRPSATTSRRTD